MLRAEESLFSMWNIVRTRDVEGFNLSIVIFKAKLHGPLEDVGCSGSPESFDDSL